jgi:AP-1 complex subunit mu
LCIGLTRFVSSVVTALPALQLEEESLRDNFVIAYELLDEVMDFGYPQFTEANILSEFIKTNAHRLAVQARPPMAVTNAVSWRQEGLFYKKNEV